MAEGPRQPTAAEKAYDRPLSPHIQIWRWTVTMAASIAHRATGMALFIGTLLLAWWVAAIASGPDAYADFLDAAGSLLGRFVLLGFTWAVSFHLLNGIRHLFWDTGRGFAVSTAKTTAVLVFAGSLLLAIGIFWMAYMVRDGVIS